MARPRNTVSISKILTGYFVRGILIFVPTVGTLYTVWLVLSALDASLGVASIPGLGIVLTLLLILATGFVASNVVGQAFVALLESGIRHLPLVNLLYSSIKDLLGAFVGDKKSFDQPAMVSLDGAGKVKVFGFVTCSRFDDVRLKGWVAVYLPQAYNFAGNVILVPKEQVESVDADPAQFMAFIVSGGVAAMGGARTMLDDGTFPPTSSRLAPRP
jgi:uncharacterized membrane protein